MSYDAECEDLARLFLFDSGVLTDELKEQQAPVLAQKIQNVIEEHVQDVEWTVANLESRTPAPSDTPATPPCAALTNAGIQHLCRYVEEHGASHDDDCPCDDTCDCSWRPTLDAVNAMCNLKLAPQENQK